MRNCSFFLASFVFVLSAACSDSKEASPPGTPDAGGGTADSGPADTGTTTEGGRTDSGPTYVEPAGCVLRDDTGGPGQYSDGCVKRAWVEPYAGTYTSTKCELTVSVDGSVAATFAMKVLSGNLAGTYTTDFDGAPSPGNDSYYRFTTDATFATTKTLNFTSGQKVGTADERALSLRVENLDTGTPSFKGRFAQVIAGVSDELDCETFAKK